MGSHTLEEVKWEDHKGALRDDCYEGKSLISKILHAEYLEHLSHQGTRQRDGSLSLAGYRDKNQYGLASPAPPYEKRELLVLAGKFIDALESVLKGSHPG